MKLEEFWLPSFNMELVSYIPNHKIELKGQNNWTELVLGRSIVISLMFLIFFFFNDFWMNNIFTRVISILPIISVLSSTFTIFKTVQKNDSLKTYILFDKKGISYNHTDENYKNQLIKAGNLKSLKIITNDNRIKIFLFFQPRPKFEFSLSDIEGINIQQLVSEITMILNLKVKDKASFDYNRSITQLADKKVNIPSKEFKPKNYFQYKKDNSSFIIEEDIEGSEVQIFPKKLIILRKERAIVEKKSIFQKTYFYYQDIDTVKYDVKEEAENYGKTTKYFITGNIYFKLKNGKSVKVFKIKREIIREREFIELEILKDIEFLNNFLVVEIFE